MVILVVQSRRVMSHVPDPQQGSNEVDINSTFIWSVCIYAGV